MSKFDVDQIERDNPLTTVAKGYLSDLKSDGKEFRAKCCFHEDNDPSLSFYEKRGRWKYHCFGCDADGDTIDFVMRIERVDFTSACEILGGTRESYGNRAATREPVETVDPYAGYTVVAIPEGENIEPGRHLEAWNPKRADDPKKHTANYKPSMVFPYRSGDEVIGYVIRQDLTNGGKLTPTIRWARHPDGREGWCHHKFDEPRPLYGVDRLNKRGQVVVCEGEKSADACMRLLGLPSVSWHGGSGGVDKADWKILAGRKVVIWGDADAPGEKSAMKVADLLHGIANEVKVIGWDTSREKGWDAADAEAEGMSAEQVKAWFKEFLTTPEPPESPPLDAYTDAADPEADEQPPEDTKPSSNMNGETPFKFLGYNGGQYFYFPEGTQQIVSLTPSAHTANSLISMAPLQWWENNFPSKYQADWLAASNALMHKSAKVGVFSGHQILRGRGAWRDGEDILIHTGSHVLKNGTMIEPGEVDSQHIYEKGSSLAITKAEPATSKEAHHLFQICDRLTWESPLSGALLAGWCVIAPLCGILPWRPHIWITGQKGSGKTTVITDVVSRVIGDIGLKMEGTTTEAGIRQTLKRDARPIIFDEAESDDRKEQQRMSAVLKLAVIASSGGVITKGTTSGDPLIYYVRSMFCFSSINTGKEGSAAESRISKLVLRQNNALDRDDHYKKLMADIAKWFTPEFSARMFARSIKWIDNLLLNAKTFTDAAALKLGDRRAADQIGPMLAGYYLCHRTDEITLERAIEEIEKNNWDDHTAVNSVSDPARCLERLTSHRVRVYVSHHQKEMNYTIGELIASVAGIKNTMISIDADEELRRIGIIVKEDEGAFTVANQSTQIGQIFADTPWAEHGARMRQLKGLKGAEPTEPRYFSSGLRSRGVALPVGLIE